MNNLIKLLLGAVFLWMISQTIVAQTCDTIAEGKLINCLDTNGLKQGIWMVCEDSLEPCFDRLGMLSLIAKGNYKNGQKVDVWEYYGGSNYSRYLIRKEIYHPDERMEEIRYNSWRREVKTIYQKDVVLSKEVKSFDFYYTVNYKNRVREVYGEFLMDHYGLKDAKKSTLRKQ